MWRMLFLCMKFLSFFCCPSFSSLFCRHSWKLCWFYVLWSTSHSSFLKLLTMFCELDWASFFCRVDRAVGPTPAEANQTWFVLLKKKGSRCVATSEILSANLWRHILGPVYPYLHPLFLQFLCLLIIITFPKHQVFLSGWLLISMSRRKKTLPAPSPNFRSNFKQRTNETMELVHHAATFVCGNFSIYF